MNKLRGWIVGLAIVALLGVGIVAVAGNGFGRGEARGARQGTSGDAAACSGSCTQSEDGTAAGDCAGYGQHLSAARPLDGTGYHGGEPAGPRNGQQAGRNAGGAGRASCDGSCG